MGQKNSLLIEIRGTKKGSVSCYYQSLKHFVTYSDFANSLLYHHEGISDFSSNKYEILIKFNQEDHYIFLDQENHLNDRLDVTNIKIQEKGSLYKCYEFNVTYPKNYQRRIVHLGSC